MSMGRETQRFDFHNRMKTVKEVESKDPEWRGAVGPNKAISCQGHMQGTGKAATPRQGRHDPPLVGEVPPPR